MMKRLIVTSAVTLLILISINKKVDSSSLDLDQKKAICFYLNMIRLDPFGFFQRQGLNLDESVQLPETLPTLKLDESLSKAAEAHVNDILERLYFSHISPEGKTPYDRAKENGYNGFIIAESLGAVAFTNYIKPIDAAIIILNNLAKSAVLEGNPEGVNIFYGGFRDVGIGFSGREISIDGKNYNVYVLCLVFGTAFGSN